MQCFKNIYHTLFKFFTFRPTRSKCFTNKNLCGLHMYSAPFTLTALNKRGRLINRVQSMSFNLSLNTEHGSVTASEEH